jgi:hypothetical protein
MKPEYVKKSPLSSTPQSQSTPSTTSISASDPYHRQPKPRPVRRRWATAA